jgi:hypothetical protein
MAMPKNLDYLSDKFKYAESKDCEHILSKTCILTPEISGNISGAKMWLSSAVTEPIRPKWAKVPELLRYVIIS